MSTSRTHPKPPSRPPPTPPTVIQNGKVTFTATRQDIIDFLVHVHVFLPPRPFWPTRLLLQMLLDVSDCLQSIAKLLRLGSLSPVIKRDDLYALSRRNVKQVWKNLWKVNDWDREHYLEKKKPVHTPFTTLRMCVTDVVICWINDHPLVRFLNPDGTTFLIIKIRKVYSVDDITTLFSVYFCIFQPGEYFMEKLDHEWPKHKTDFFGPFHGYGFGFEIFLSQLLVNADRVPEKWRDDAPPGYCTSFLVPPTRLNVRDAINFSNNDGCPICGDDVKVWCSDCRSAWYCTEDHREVHWEEHEPCCVIIRNAEWVRLVFDMEDYTGLTSLGIPHNIPQPANIWGKAPFKITAQYTMPDRFTLYDSREPGRFYVVVHQEGQHQSQRNAWMLVRRSAWSGVGGRMQFWAKRTGEWVVDIAANRPLDMAEDREKARTVGDKIVDWLWVMMGGRQPSYGGYHYY